MLSFFKYFQYLPVFSLEQFKSTWNKKSSFLLFFFYKYFYLFLNLLHTAQWVESINLSLEVSKMFEFLFSASFLHQKMNIVIIYLIIIWIIFFFPVTYCTNRWKHNSSIKSTCYFWIFIFTMFFTFRQHIFLIYIIDYVSKFF